MSCTHELVLNGACYYCGSTDLDPQALSPKKDDDPSFVPTERLRRPPKPTADEAGAPAPASSENHTDSDS